MLGHLNAKTYLGIAVVVAIVLILLGFVAGPQLVGFFETIETDALRHGISSTIVSFVVQPFILILSNPIIGGIVGGLVWPLILAWLLLLILLIVLSAFGGGVNVGQGTGDF